MTQQTENITLKSFFIYNSTFGPNEGEVRILNECDTVH